MSNELEDWEREQARFEQQEPLEDRWRSEDKEFYQAGHGFVVTVVHAFGRTTTERRVSNRLKKVRWALEMRSGDLTDAQKQALAMVYGCVMPPAECGRRLGIKRQSFRERLLGGEKRVDRMWDSGGRRRYKKGRSTAVLHAPKGAARMVEVAREALGIGADYIWGNEPPPPSPEWEAEYQRVLRAHGTSDERIRESFEE